MLCFIFFVDVGLGHRDPALAHSQDSHLLATQQQYVLPEEFAAQAAGKSIRRTQMYQYASPGERLLVALGRFLDATVPLQPRRYAALPPDAPPDAAAFEPRFLCPPREVTLDRFAQHTAICPDSQGALRNARRIAAAAALAAVALFAKPAVAIAAAVAASGSGAVLGTALEHAGWLAAAAAAVGIARFAQWLTRQFYFVYTEKDRDEHLAKIPKIMPDEV